jgi:phosphoglycolate phosphatase
MLAEGSRPPLDRETVIGFVGRGVEILVRRVLNHVDWTVSEAEFQRLLASFHRHYNADPISTTTLYPGALQLMSGARDRGLPMGLCTNKPEAPARAICMALGFADYLDIIVGGDTLDVKKPDPKTLLETVRQLGGTPADTLYIGDSETDYLTARAAQIPFIFFEGGYQLVPIPDFRPDHVVGSLSEVLGILDRQGMRYTH